MPQAAPSSEQPQLVGPALGAIVAGLPLGSGHGPTHHFWFLEGTGLFPADDR